MRISDWSSDVCSSDLRANWQLIDNGFEGGEPALAVDGRKETFVLTRKTDLPQQVVVDMGQMHTLTGFSYLPRQDGRATGLVSRYTLATSGDGVTWNTTAAGEFASIVANPIMQYVSFTNEAAARYFRFTVDALVGTDRTRSRVSIAELNMSGADTNGKDRKRVVEGKIGSV